MCLRVHASHVDASCVAIRSDFVSYSYRCGGQSSAFQSQRANTRLYFVSSTTGLFFHLTSSSVGWSSVGRFSGRIPHHGISQLFHGIPRDIAVFCCSGGSGNLHHCGKLCVHRVLCRRFASYISCNLFEPSDNHVYKLGGHNCAVASRVIVIDCCLVPLRYSRRSVSLFQCCCCIGPRGSQLVYCV